MPERHDTQQQEPDPSTDYSAFPHRQVDTGTVWWRQHTHRLRAPDGGAWWFASVPTAGMSGGRFDLPSPHGSCYLASTRTGAVRELVGPDHVARGWVEKSLLAGRVVSRLQLPTTVRTANVASGRAGRWRISSELTTMTDYAVTRAWAAALFAAGFAGLHAALRFTPGSTRALVLFGPAGAPDPFWPGDPAPVPVEYLVKAQGVTLVDTPVWDQLEVLDPPT